MPEDRDEKMLTRREALVTLGGAMGAALAVACEPVTGSGRRNARTSQQSESSADKKKKSSARMPAVFLPHGGGPWPFIDENIFGAPGMWDEMERYMRGLSMVAPTKPKAILMISAHWEEPVPTVMTAEKPPMLYDYYGFPPEAYEVEWPAPGQPELAAQVRDHLESAGIRTSQDDQRGFDHGTFVPLKLTYPKADVPTIQLSLVRGLNPREHLAIGRALAPLRDAGVLMIGSGMSYHNLRAFMRHARGGPDMRDESRAFDEWLLETVSAEASRRETRLVEWEKAPKARESHPREEHLLPLMVIAGAAEDDRGTLPYRDVVMGAHVSAAHFG